MKQQPRLIPYDDLPLFSGAAPTATIAAFAPTPVTRQTDMFGAVVAFGESEMGAIKRPLALPTIGDMSDASALAKEEQRWVVESGEGAVLIYKHSVSNPGLYAMTYATQNGCQASWIVAPEIASDAWELDEIECDGDRLIWTLTRGDDVAYVTWYEDGSMSGLVESEG